MQDLVLTMLSPLLLLLSGVLELTYRSPANAQLPTVDLYYSVYRANSLNETGAYYNFSNIRYAAPPLGQLRFADPTPPLVDRSKVHDGSVGFVCPQSSPLWWKVALRDLGTLTKVIPGTLFGPSQSEDCLFLDVITPIKVFDAAQSKPAKLVPVLVNIHGGGFFQGEKVSVYPPQGLLHLSGNEFVYVSIQYRLGAFGFLTGFAQAPANATSPNAGLLDQRLALTWVQEYIHLFGGDPEHVTIIGESAGGGSVEFHTVAYGGSKPKQNILFKRAIAQSPAPIIVDGDWQARAANLFLNAAGVKSVDELRTLPTQKLQDANEQAQALVPYNVLLFAPTVDGDLITDLPRRLFTQGKFIKDLDIMASYTANEGRTFANQSIKTNADYDNWVRQNLPSASSDIQSYISETLYPPKYDGSQPYKTPLERLELTTKEYLISCNTIDIARAYGNRNYNSIIAVKPAIHAQDLAYTYNNGGEWGVDVQTADLWQKYIVNMILAGNPNGAGLPRFPVYTSRNQVLKSSEGGRVEQVGDPAANSRCEWWSKGFYAPSYPRYVDIM